MTELNNLKKLSDFDNKSLLIVDDDNPFRERLARAMEKKGFEVFQAESVEKGIQSAKDRKLGFAVVDLRLTDGNGLNVVKQIQISNSNSHDLACPETAPEAPKCQITSRFLIFLFFSN